MAKIIISSKGKNLQEVEINKTITIGREVGDIMIKHPAVSARHAKIEKKGDVYSIEDLGSTNGTLVNDESVTIHELKSGDVITIGKYNLRFDNPVENKPASEPSGLGGDDLGGRTMVMDPSKIQSMMAASKTGKPVGGGAADRGIPKLFLAQASGAPKILALEKETTVIGASDDADVTIKGITVGKTAATITKVGDDYRIEFKGGMAKLKVNGEPADDHLLSNGDKFSIGSFDFQFRTKM